VNAQLEQIWPRLRSQLANAVDESTFRLWIEPLSARELTADTLVLEAPPHVHRWVRERFGRLLRATAAQTLGRAVDVELVQSDASGNARGARWAGTTTDPPPDARTSRWARPINTHGLHEGNGADPLGNPRLAFEHFVIGGSNRLAHAAALAVAELPGYTYNPLFICGPPGVGKTHLLRSIARMIRLHSPGLGVRVSTGEAFTTEFQLALGANRMNSFKARFRDVDVLLVDDVQFLERKARTEEEFFHTFDVLLEAGAQVVLTSDRPPRDLQALEDRLRERFAAGLVADVHLPDVKTRRAILRKRVQYDELQEVDPLALDVIARRVPLDVRALEGALVRIVAFSSLTRRALSDELATEVLDSLQPRPNPARRSLDEIKAAACTHFDLTPDELLSPSRGARVAWPRQVAMYLARELTAESLPAIGRHFGGRDHTTVLHAWRRTAAKIHADTQSRRAVDTLREQLEQGAC
jgi:chromosomal replication initiator protein